MPIVVLVPCAGYHLIMCRTPIYPNVSTLFHHCDCPTHGDQLLPVADLAHFQLSRSSSTSINKLQVMQNAALRTSTGCTQDTNIQHLHDETLTFPIHEHLELHASQYKQKTQHPSHWVHLTSAKPSIIRTPISENRNERKITFSSIIRSWK